MRFGAHALYGNPAPKTGHDDMAAR